MNTIISANNVLYKCGVNRLDLTTKSYNEIKIDNYWNVVTKAESIIQIKTKIVFLECW